jgi:hypothetical protein
MRKRFYIPLILLIITSIIIIYICLRIPYINTNFKYFYSNRIGKIHKETFETYNIINDNTNWNIYLPNGYNNIEKELKIIKTDNYGYNKYIFGINGTDWFVSKNGLWYILKEQYGRDNASLLMPESYLLYDKDDVNHLKKIFNNEYYILKKNIQRKTGLKITNKLSDIVNGNKEGFKVVQKYMHNVFLVNGRKLNIRIYILIVYKNHKHIYIYKDGKCIYTNKKYNNDITDFESNITSYKMDYSIYNSNPYSIDELNRYIKEVYNIEIDIFEKIKELMKQVCYAIKNYISKSDNIQKSTTYQLYGVDILLDNNLNPYILEMNKGPDMHIRCEKDKILKTGIYEDIYGILKIINKNNNKFIKLHI